MGYIYIIRNTANDKVYIGQTIDTLQRRMNKHRSEARRYARGMVDAELRNKRGTCSKLYNAMNAYGINNFYIETLEEMDNDLLNGIEMQYISKYNAVAQGYNLKLGGDNSPHCEETKKLISEKTREGISKHIDNYRKHEEVKGLPVHCVYVKIKGSDAVAINKHPQCKWKSFTVRKYGSIENAKIELLKHLESL